MKTDPCEPPLSQLGNVRFCQTNGNQLEFVQRYAKLMLEGMFNKKMFKEVNMNYKGPLKRAILALIGLGAI